MRWCEPLERRALLSGLTGQYFDRVDFTELKLTRLDPAVNFNWGTAAPNASMGADGFAVRWTGQVEPATSEKYAFYVTSDDGVRLWVDGRLVIDSWVNQSAKEKTATLPLAAGQLYDIRLDYYDASSTAVATLSWSSPSIVKQIIPSSRLFPSSAGLRATFYDNADFTGSTAKRTDLNINFDWGAGSPDPAIGADTFAARWTGQIVAQYSQTYSFFVTTDAGSTARLRVDESLVLDSTSIQDAGQIRLEAGKRYDIQLDYSQNTGSASVKLEWSAPSLARQVVPASALLASNVSWAPTRLANYTNSVNDNDRPDPGILFSDGYYWMTHTTGGPDSGWPLKYDSDLVSGWTSAGNMLNASNKPAWMTGKFWAPEFHKINGKYIITGTSDSTTYGHLVIAMASASEIAGPYTVRSTPIVNDTVGCLDSHIFQDFDGRVYLIWKRQGPSGGAHGSIQMRELDGNDPTTFTAGSVEVTLLNNTVGGWEKYIEEAPWMIHRGSYYYLFYSGANIDTTYAEGVARATSILGPYTRAPANPILQSNATWGGPGHGAFVEDVDGTVWFYYHARHQANTSYGRVQMLDRTVWTADGWPSFGNGGTPSVSQQIGPRVTAASGAGRYVVNGDAAGAVTNDTFRLVRDSGDSSLLDVLVNDVTRLTAPFAEIENLTFDGVGGNDTLILDYSRGEVIPGSGISFNGNSGSDTIRLVAAAGDSFHLNSAQITHDTGIVTAMGVETISLQGGVAHLDGDLRGAGLDATSTTLLAHFDQRLSSLTLSGTSQLDLANHHLIVDYTSASPLAPIATMIASGRNGGSWNGSGIITSMTAARAPAMLTTLGVAEAASALNLSGTQTALWDGETVDSSTVLIRYTFAGDANLDGVITGDDFFAIDSGFVAHASGYANGDFDYSGKVNADDYFLIDSNHHIAQTPPVPAMSEGPQISGGAVGFAAAQRVFTYQALIESEKDLL